MRNASEDEPVDRRRLELGIYCRMCYRLQKSAHYLIKCKAKEEEVQNLCYGMPYLQGTYLERVLERGI